MPDIFSAVSAAVDCIYTEEKPSNRKTTHSSAAVFRQEVQIVLRTISGKMYLTKSCCTI